MKVIITIPAYNEERTIGRVISEIKQVMKGYNFQILVLNDGSRDRTEDVAKKAGAIVVTNKRNLGLAKTFRIEMRKCLELKADIIVHTDADGQYPSEYIPEMVEKVKSGYDLVLGARFGKGRYKGSFMNRMGNIAFASVFSRLLGFKIRDTTTGFRAFNSDVASLPTINKFTYTQEQIIRTIKEGMAIKEIPITTRRTRKSRLFKNSFDYAIKAWINILRIYRDYEPLKFFGSIGFVFLAWGLGIGVYVFSNWIMTGRVGALPRVFLSMLLIITGVQIALFGFLADMRK